MEKVNGLKYDSKPDYKSFHDLLRAAGQKAGLKDEWKLDLGAPGVLSPTKVGGSTSGEQAGLGLGLTGEREMGEHGEFHTLPYQELEETSSDFCPAEGCNAGGLVVVGHKLGRLEELLACLLHQLSSDILNHERLYPNEVFGSLVIILATMYVIYQLSAAYFIQPPTSLEEKLRLFEEETM